MAYDRCLIVDEMRKTENFFFDSNEIDCMYYAEVLTIWKWCMIILVMYSQNYVNFRTKEGYVR